VTSPARAIEQMKIEDPERSCHPGVKELSCKGEEQFV